jgi:hypothetical protein
LMLMVLMPLSAQNAEESDADLLMNSRYEFWFKADQQKAQADYRKIKKLTAESAWHGADLLRASGKNEEAFNLLVKALKRSYGRENKSLVRRIFRLKPELLEPIRVNGKVYISKFYMQQHSKNLWLIKKGVPLLIEKNAAGTVVSLRIKHIVQEGLVARSLGFSQNDRIYKVNGKAVGDWSKYEVPFFFSKVANKNMTVKVEMQALGDVQRFTRTFNIMDNGEFIRKKLKVQKRTK